MFRFFVAGLAMVGFATTSLAQDPDTHPFLLGPPHTGTPVPVSVGFFLSDVTDVNEERQMFEFEGRLTLQWKDERQAFDSEQLGVSERIYQGNFQFSEVFDGWWPQLVLANESGQYDRQGVLLRIQPDGSMTYVEQLDAVVKTPMDLHHFPFDKQGFEIIFKVLGFDRSEVVIQPDLANTGFRAQGLNMAQWAFNELDISPLDHDLTFKDGSVGARSHVAVHIKMSREPAYMLRLVVFPLFILVALSWSIFWMEKESIGDRMDISFLGILTVVAYQITISEILPSIDYFTLMSAFLYLSFLSMASGVAVNLIVNHLDKRGNYALGDQIDWHCRWLFPTAFVGLNLLAAVYFLMFR